MKKSQLPYMEEKLWTAQQVASLLKVSLRQITLMVANALMPEPMRLGKLLRWSKEEITAWLDAGAPNQEQWNQMKAQPQG